MYARPQLHFLVKVRAYVVSACLESYSFRELPHFFLKVRDRITRAVQALVHVLLWSSMHKLRCLGASKKALDGLPSFGLAAGQPMGERLGGE